MFEKRACGFTLLELIIVVVVVAVLAGIALPAYQEQIRKSRRASAQSHLLDVAAKEQAYFVDARGSYAATLAALRVVTPQEVAENYTITITTAVGPPPTFVVRATAIGNQVKDLGTGVDLTVDNSGAKSPSDKW